MKDTGFSVPEAKRNRLTKTYKHGPDGKLREEKPLIEVWPEPGRGVEAGGAGIFSTAGDYARFAQMLCNGGTLEGRRILGRKTVELMTANHMVSLPNNRWRRARKGSVRGRGDDRPRPAPCLLSDTRQARGDNLLPD